MTHLQSKSSLFHQQLSKIKQENCSSRNRLKFEASNIQHDVFYSDEDSLVKYELQDQTEIEGIINQAQVDFGRNMAPKDDSRRKGRSISKRKGKAKNRDVKTISIITPNPNFASFQSSNQQLQIQSPNTKTIKDAFAPLVVESNKPLKIEEKKPAEKTNIIQSPPILQGTDIQNKPYQHFHLFPQYRAYFEKQIESSYDQYQKKMEGLFKQALGSKVRDMIIAEKHQKANFIRKLQQYKSRFKIVPKVIHSIPEDPVSTPVNITFQDLAVCMPLEEKNQQNRNKHHRIITENDASFQNANENNKVLTPSLSNPTVSKDNDLLDLLKDPRAKRREKPVRIEGERKITSQSSGSANGVRPLQVQLNKTNDRNKILASIQLVNRQCQQQEKHQRMESQRLEREREEKQRSKQAKKEQASSNASHSNQQAKREGDQVQTERRIQQNIREGYGYYSSRANPKIKRLQILNRYHYNPFQQTEGQDQCELWKKLMGVEIKNLSSQYGSSKLQDTNLQTKKSIIEELLKEVADRENDKQGKDIFIMPNNYQPNFQSQPSSDEISIPQKRKSSKSKSHKKHKGRHRKHKDKKNSKESRQSLTKQFSNEQDIGTFLNLQEQAPKKQEEEYHGPQDNSNNWDPDQPQQNLERQSLSQLQSHEPISERSDQAFSYDQLDDLEDYQDIFGKGKQVKQEHIEPTPLDIHDIDYYEELVKRHVRK